jgi:hypothetical protein
MATLYSPKIVTDGLVLALDAANTESYPGSGTAWADLSGNGNSYNLVNGPTFDTTFGGNIVFDGANDFWGTSNILQYTPTDSFTLSVVAYVSDIAGDNTAGRVTTVFGRGSTGGSIGIGAIKNTNGTFQWTIGSRAVNIIYSVYTLNLNEINHITFVYDGATQLSGTASQYIYFNGSLQTTQDVTAGLGGAFDANGWGSFINRAVPGGNSAYGNGAIFTAHIYGRALTEAEVFQNYNATKGRFGL